MKKKYNKTCIFRMPIVTGLSQSYIFITACSGMALVLP